MDVSASGYSQSPKALQAQEREFLQRLQFGTSFLLAVFSVFRDLTSFVSNVIHSFPGRVQQSF